MFKILLFCMCFHILRGEKFHGRGFFGGTYTTTVVEKKTSTSVVPSSCVQVDATLPPCRSVRYLNFATIPMLSFNESTKSEVVTDEPKTETTSLGWGEYLGFYNPTVTVTTTDISTTVVQDPSVVVTFVVKGCRPLMLPLNLDQCPPEYTSTNNKEIINTVTVSSPILPTQTLTTSMMTESPSNINMDNVNFLDPSTQEIAGSEHFQPTVAL